MKNKLFLNLFIITLGLSSSALAKDENCETCAANSAGKTPAITDLKDLSTQTAACSSLDQMSPLGTRCMTSKGVEFVRVKDGWKDTGTNGKTWYDDKKNSKLYYNNSQVASEKYCNEKGLGLPSKTDFEIAESHGFREVLKDMKEKLLWTTTVDEGNKDGNYFFFNRSGDFGTYFRERGDFYNYSCRCVAK